MKLRIRHEIGIGIGAGAARAVQHLLLTPRSFSGQTVSEWTITGPGIETAGSYADACGNTALIVNQSKPDAELVFTAAGTVETIDKAGVVGRVPGEPVPALFLRRTALAKAEDALVEGLDGTTRERVALLHTLMARVGDGTQAQTQSQSQDGQSQSQGEAAEPSGLTHRFIGALRALGIPARYITGYLAPEDEAPPAFHAWAEAYDDRLGWIGFDCALQLCPTERHVRLAAGLDAASTVPVRSVPAAGALSPLTIAIDATQ